MGEPTTKEEVLQREQRHREREEKVRLVLVDQNPLQLADPGRAYQGEAHMINEALTLAQELGDVESLVFWAFAINNDGASYATAEIAARIEAF